MNPPRTRTVAACLDSARDEIHEGYAHRIHARAHLANMAPERFAQLNREWMDAENVVQPMEGLARYAARRRAEMGEARWQELNEGFE